jgi:hypothetical protein
MKSILSCLAALLVGGVAPAATPASAAAGILEQYFVIHENLAGDTTAGIQAAALKLAKLSRQAAAQDPKVGAQLAAVSQAAIRLQTGDLKTARNEFGELSKRVTAWLQAAGGEKPHQFYCSMANKGWLRQDRQTRNPYYGKSMLTCGELIP